MSGEIICSPEFVKRQFPAAEDHFCFVIMPFEIPLLQEIYEQHVKGVIEESGLSCIRGDDIYSINSVMEDVWTSLCRCRIVVGEFTGRNPNVLYEAGIAHTLGKPLVMITQDLGDIPFDFKHIRVIEYRNSPSGYEELRQKLKRTLVSVLGEERPVWPQSLDDQMRRSDLLAKALADERERSQGLYVATEERHRQQIRHFHNRISELSSPSPEVTPIELCQVEATEVSVDSWDEGKEEIFSGPRVTVASFEIGKYPITNGQYEEFVKQTGHYPPEHWLTGKVSDQIRDLPVVGVSWNDVSVFCEWFSQSIGRAVRLPSEAEWLAAAGYGRDQQRFPWGDEWRENACNSAEGRRVGHTSVQEYEEDGKAPSGCVDLLGNVWEWTSSFYSGDGDLPWRAVRGGAHYTPLAEAGSLARLVAFPGHFLFVRDLGFRVVVGSTN